MVSRLRRIPWLPALGGIATALALILAVATIVHNGGLASHDCQQIELIKTRIRTAIIQEQRTLGRPGSAGYAYYLAHPTELAAARAGARQTVGTFAPSRC